MKKTDVRPYALNKAKLDPGMVVQHMTRVQRLAYLAGQMDLVEAQEWGDKIFQMRRDAFEGTLEAELAVYGCGGPVRLTTGPELTAMRRAADTIGAGIANTYNYWLAHEIMTIGTDVPTANRHVYAHRLFYADTNWADDYWARRKDMISSTETSAGVNRSLLAFYRNNDLPHETAEVVPYPTMCPVCDGYVSGNPYDSMEDLYRQCDLPAHPYCPHHGIPLGIKRLSSQECAELWRG